MSIPLILKAVEESGFSVWIRESPSLFAYWFFLTLHALGMGMAVGASVVIDFRILGVAKDMPLTPLKGLYGIIWAGFWIQVVSGLLLLIAYPTKALTNPVFYIKLVLIALGVVALKRIERQLSLDAAARDSAPAVGRSLALWMLGLWLGVLTAGRALAYTATYLLYGKGT